MSEHNTKEEKKQQDNESCYVVKNCTVAYNVLNVCSANALHLNIEYRTEELPCQDLNDFL